MSAAPSEATDRGKKEDGGPAPVPEPLLLAVVGSGLLALSFAIRNRENRVQSQHAAD